MNVFEFDMTADGDDVLVKAIRLVFETGDYDGSKINGQPRGAKGYIITPATGDVPARLVFLWYIGKGMPGAVDLPFVMNTLGCAEFAKMWLGQIERCEETDTDGHCEKGWRVTNKMDGLAYHYGIVAVEPAWIVYGK